MIRKFYLKSDPEKLNIVSHNEHRDLHFKYRVYLKETYF